MSFVRVLCMIPLISSAALAVVGCSSDKGADAPATTGSTGSTGSTSTGSTSTTGSTGSTKCDTLAAYTATATTPPSFATDVLPILKMQTGASCSTTTICHGSTPASLKSGLYMAGSSDPTLMFDDPADTAGTGASALAALMADSFSAPGMKRVAPGNVGKSFLAHKIASTPPAVDALTCLPSGTCNSMSSGKASSACGATMPSGIGSLSDPQRTTILDWIALGAMP